MDVASVDPFEGFQALRNILVDRNSATLSGELRRRQIPHLLLKGPSFARWLYGPDEVRPYFDTDLLVSPDRWDEAVSLLEGLGYAPEPDAFGHPRMEGLTGVGFVNGEAHVDLHGAIDGVGVSPEAAWARLSQATETIDLDGTVVDILDAPARLLHVALHAAHHHEGVPLMDLERALARAHDGDWAAAAALSEDLEATGFFVVGLGLVPAGAALTRRLDLEGRASVEAALHVSDVPLAAAVHHLLRTPGTRPKLAIIRSELVSSPEFMRWWTPLARRPRGMPAAYAYRLGWLLAKVPGAIGQLVRARRARRLMADRPPAAGGTKVRGWRARRYRTPRPGRR